MGALRSHFSYENGQVTMQTNTIGRHTLKMIHTLLFEDELGFKVAFKKDDTGKIAYFYYTHKDLDLIAHAKKVKEKLTPSDVKQDNPYKAYIANVAAFDIINATPGNLFELEATMTQGEFVQPTLRAQGWHQMPYALEVNKNMIMKDIVNYEEKSSITRQMAAVMIQDLKQLPVGSKIKLVGEVDDWAIPHSFPKEL